ncbi:Abf2p [Saccharomyces cerevisiae x Saccharomyces kudriavzevii VIN7]|uniref:Abf2p n=1 Tax=Saccharomyces cerevisiae x Saccharomyces kudriavzevii (strain VIN7) TaxID=1095631 RepID=H0GZ56_SACCK|nr:Abf2p [Saccharomyces cerevisiae x Saccharomyces kudriavzevii VIN7]
MNMSGYSLLSRSFHQSTKPLFNLSSILLKASKRTQLRNELIKQGPKRPTSAYFLFLQDHRSQFAKENPTLRPSEISKIAGEKWQTLKSDIKDKYISQRKELYSEYQKAKKEFDDKLPPKRPAGPFIKYANEVRSKVFAQHPDKSQLELMKVIGDKWQSLDQNTKNKYIQEYKKAIQEYNALFPLN